MITEAAASLKLSFVMESETVQMVQMRPTVVSLKGGEGYIDVITLGGVSVCLKLVWFF